MLFLDDLMEDFFKSLLNKRRPRQLSSESSTDTSPEAKRLKEKDSSSPKQRDEGDDIILLALNMFENLQKSLENILKKLEKFDAIQVAVNNFQKSFEKLERRLQVLEEDNTNIKQDVQDLKTNLYANEVDKNTTDGRIQKIQDNVDAQLATLEILNSELREKLKLVEDKHL